MPSLLDPDVLSSSAVLPKAEFPAPVVFVVKAVDPKAEFPEAVVFDANALAPKLNLLIQLYCLQEN
jgi:hypothetical protein